MKGQCLACFCMVLLSTPLEAKDWHLLYGEKITFNVYRDDRHVGRSTTEFVKQGHGWDVVSQMELSVPIFFLLSFDYTYQSKERWRNGILQQLDVDENRNGKVKKIRLSTSENTTKLKGHIPSGQVEIELPVLTSNHYNNDVINSRQLLNTLTGKVNQYVLVAVEKEQVKTNKGLTQAYRYRYEGDLKDTEVWYDESGHWVKLWFKGDDGSAIELRCVYCMK